MTQENPARWAEDPTGQHELRYWDGQRWTDHVSGPGVASRTGPIPGPAEPAPAPAPSRGWPTSARVGTALAAVIALVALAGSASPEQPAGLATVEANSPSSVPSTTAEVRFSAPSVPPATEPPTTTTTTFVAPAPADAAASTEAFLVRSITDGDTLGLADGRRVRLAQVDAPETDECFGTQSTAALSAMAAGKTVTLRRPSSGPATDTYGRTLADVYVGDRSVNEALVRDGAAEWYDRFAGEDPNLARRLQAAENEARITGRGLWSQCAASSATAPTPAPAPATTTPPPAAATGSECHPAYPDNCIPPPPPDRDCPDIARKVRVDHRFGDPHGFDRDKDGWGCESYG